jgi:molybdopterin/thiamine biosynthesis adenylyltransferase
MAVDFSLSRANAHAELVGNRPRHGRLVAGGAGNIGSYAVTYLTVYGRVASLSILDRDVVEARNVENQFYELCDVGRPKAEVTAERLRRIAPDMDVEAIVADLEDLPLGVIADADLCLGAFDSLRARQAMANECAYPLGIPFVDGAVDGEGGWYGTVQVFVPGAACLECKWGSGQYRQLSRELPCGSLAASPAAPNRASALLGAVVARVMTDEAVRILGNEGQQDSYEIAMDVHQGRRLVSRLRPARHCRFDHVIARERVSLGRPFAQATVDDLRQAALDWAGEDQPQMEFRRTVFGRGPLEPSRWQTPGSLVHFAGRLLSEVGLTARDRIRLQASSRSAFLELEASITSRPGRLIQ